MALLEFNSIRKHFDSFKITPTQFVADWVTRSIGTVGDVVLGYKMQNLNEFHTLGLLLDPFNKWSIKDIPGITPNEVNFTTIRTNKFFTHYFF